jgi:multiple sugar transport system permease protein
MLRVENMKPNVFKDSGKIITTAVMLVIGIFFLYPLFWMLSASLKLPAAVFEYPMRWIPENPRFSNFAEVWLNPVNPFYLFYLNSLKVTLLTVLGVLILCSTSAYAFAKMNFPGKNLIFMLFLSTMMIPTQVTLIPRYVLFQQIGLYNTHWALILPPLFYVVGIFLLRQFYYSIPNELIEATKIDGASHFRIFTFIVLPLTKPAMISLIILKFVSSWNEYMDPLIFLVSGRLFTIPLGMQIYMDAEGQQLQLVMAAAALNIVPVIILFVTLQKYFIQGIATSGLKG